MANTTEVAHIIPDALCVWWWWWRGRGWFSLYHSCPFWLSLTSWSGKRPFPVELAVHGTGEEELSSLGEITNCLIYHCVSVYAMALYSPALAFHSFSLLVWIILVGAGKVATLLSKWLSLLLLLFQHPEFHVSPSLSSSLFLHWTQSPSCTHFTLSFKNKGVKGCSSSLQCFPLGGIWKCVGSNFGYHSAGELLVDFGRQGCVDAKHPAVYRVWPQIMVISLS